MSSKKFEKPCYRGKKIFNTLSRQSTCIYSHLCKFFIKYIFAYHATFWDLNYSLIWKGSTTRDTNILSVNSLGQQVCLQFPAAKGLYLGPRNSHDIRIYYYYYYYYNEEEEEEVKKNKKWIKRKWKSKQERIKRVKEKIQNDNEKH